MANCPPNPSGRVQALVMSAWAFFTNDKICRGFSPALEWKHALAVAEATQ